VKTTERNRKTDWKERKKTFKAQNLPDQRSKKITKDANMDATGRGMVACTKKIGRVKGKKRKLSWQQGSEKFSITGPDNDKPGGQNGRRATTKGIKAMGKVTHLSSNPITEKQNSEKREGKLSQDMGGKSTTLRKLGGERVSLAKR